MRLVVRHLSWVDIDLGIPLPATFSLVNWKFVAMELGKMMEH